MYGRVKRVAPAVLIGLGIAAFPGSALAGVAHVDGDTVVYDAYVGENNDVAVGEVDDGFRVDFEIHDTHPDAGAGCSRIDFQTVTCGISTVGQTPHVEINLGNDNDRAQPAFLHPITNRGMTVDGGPGNDQLFGGPRGDTLDGGDGDDTINGAAGSDQLIGYYGADLIHGNDDDDTIDGGPGVDDLNGDAGDDTLTGGAAGDTLRGGADDDTLYGNAGQDNLFGNFGLDTYFGGTEADDISADDNQNETVDCGSGLFAKDSANINDGDDAIDCEKVS